MSEQRWTIYRCPLHGGDTLEAGHFCARCGGIESREYPGGFRGPDFEAITVVPESELTKLRATFLDREEAA